MLKDQTKAMIARLAAVDWFGHVGEKIEDDSIIQVYTWKDAVSYCRKRYSANVQIESKNALTERLFAEHVDHYQHWNEIGQAIGLAVDSLIDRKTLHVTRVNRLTKAFKDSVAWDIVGICQELEFADLIPPRFFAERAKWYLAGHFPCGWEGDFPIGGKLVVF